MKQKTYNREVIKSINSCFLEKVLIIVKYLIRLIKKKTRKGTNKEFEE